MTPTGSEQPAETRGKTASGPLSPPQSPPSQAIGADELLRLWAAMDEAARRDLLAVARGLAAKAVTK